MFTSIALQLGRPIFEHMKIRMEVVDFMRLQREVVGIFHGYVTNFVHQVCALN
jgi:hypothetical protein